MKHRMMNSLGVIALLLALSSPSPAVGRHPTIERALAALREVKEHLERAPHDFGGHRVDAIKAVDEAAHQLQICMQY